MRKGLKKAGIAILAVAMMMTGGVLTSLAATRLDTVSDVWWNDDNITVGEWEEVEDAFQYEIYLYHNDSKVAEFKTKKVKYNMDSKMTQAGEYTFRVRALAKSGSREYSTSYWSSYSDGIYIEESYAELMRNGGKIDTQNSGPGTVQGETDSVPAATVTPAGQWINDTNGWWYRKTDGTFPAGQWFADPATGKWYYFQQTGYMVTGWINLNEVYYYCGSDGAMVTGQQVIDGVTYQFDASGARITS